VAGAVVGEGSAVARSVGGACVGKEGAAVGEESATVSEGSAVGVSGSAVGEESAVGDSDACGGARTTGVEGAAHATTMLKHAIHAVNKRVRTKRLASSLEI